MLILYKLKLVKAFTIASLITSSKCGAIVNAIK
jgi:hypothetical protein